MPAATGYHPARSPMRWLLPRWVRGETSAGWLEGMIEASLAPSDDVSRGSMGTEAGNDLQDAGQALVDAAALAKAARTGCR